MNERPQHRIRAVVVDDQPLERTGIALILDSDDAVEVVGEAGSGREAVEVVERLAPDIVLMDVRMPGMDGIEATRIITDSRPSTRVIVLTTFDLDDYAFGSLIAGASAFLLKSTRPEALVDAVKTVASGSAVAAPRLTAKLIEHYLEARSAEGTASSTETGVSPAATEPAGREDALAAGCAPGVIDALSPRERDIFIAVVRGLTNAEISAELTLAQSTVKSHINSIFAKLDLRDRVHAVILGYELGLARPE